MESDIKIPSNKSYIHLKLGFLSGRTVFKIINFQIYFFLVNIPFFANLSDCRSFGLVKCENIQLDGGQGMLGAWYVNLNVQQDSKESNCKIN